MLPHPVSGSYPRRRPFQHRSLYSPSSQSLFELIFSRSRVTNLGLFAVSALAGISLTLNLIFWWSAGGTSRLGSATVWPDKKSHRWASEYFRSGFAAGTVTSTSTVYACTEPETRPTSTTTAISDDILLPPAGILSTISRSDALGALDHLVIVPGHAIWKGINAEARLDPAEWVLEEYQQGTGGSSRVATFVNHITRGVEIARNDERAVLMFSGGQTRQSSMTTEAESYMRLALASGLLQTPDSTTLPAPQDPVHPGPPPPPPPVQQPPTSTSPAALPLLSRTTTETYALDSLQNLLFSIARFHEFTGRYPTRITIVGYKIKRRRFAELHRMAIRWPETLFDYVGIDPEGEALERARQGEYTNGYRPYVRDTYGCHPPLLDKKQGRNPSMRFHSYYTSAPELRLLFDWCPGSAEAHGGMTKLFEGSLPWDALKSTEK